MIWLLHGNVGGPGDWEPVASVLRGKGMTCEAVNLWNWIDDGVSSLTGFGREFSRHVGGRDPESVLVGYSMGGRLAMHALLSAPSAWRRAVIVSAHPGLPEAERAARVDRDLEWARSIRDASWEAFLEEWNDQPVFVGERRENETCGLAIERWSPQVARAFEVWSIGLQDDLTPGLSEAAVPVLWINGERDRKFVEAGGRVAATCLNVRHEIVPGHGHRMLRSAAGELAEMISGFVTK